MTQKRFNNDNRFSVFKHKQWNGGKKECGEYFGRVLKFGADTLFIIHRFSSSAKSFIYTMFVNLHVIFST
jgi:hypothetical protein